MYAIFNSSIYVQLYRYSTINRYSNLFKKVYLKMEGEQLIIILSLNLIVVIYSERWSHVKRHQKQQIVEFNTQRVFLLSRKIHLKLKESKIML